MLFARASARTIEIVGEAAAQVSRETREAFSEVPRREIVAMRNRLIHAYFDIDYEVSWKTLVEDLPPLSRQLEAILGRERGS